ncbi:glycosyltransferase [Marinilabilia sp.]|uniref:glycosyltransferase family protein n=1 Tax=Marinilabilia sp. TaxID=2021252 RepID=UPI0025C298A6|nr:glycosyltransferase [Marinilabilia sp.]
MKILYVAEATMPGQKADSIHVMRMCRSMVKAGHEVRLLAFKGNSFESMESCFEYYGVEPMFQAQFIKAPGSGRMASLALGMTAMKEVLRWKPDLAYTRTVTSAFFMSRVTRNLVLESHTFFFKAARVFHRFFFKSVMQRKSLRGMVVISAALKKMYASEGFSDNRLFVAHDGSDVVPRDETEKLKGDHDLNVGYFGSVFKGRGIERILEMAKARRRVGFHFFGAEKGDMKVYGHLPGNCYFYGFISPSEVYRYRNVCDVLLAPYQQEVYVSDKQAYSTSMFMSPLKIFEYMSAGKAIIVSDMPVLKEVLSPKQAILVDPEDSQAWIEALDRLESNPALRKELGSAALETFMKKYTWDQRAREIVEWCSSRLN